MYNVKHASVSVTHTPVFLCVMTPQATGYVPWCVWVPQSLCMYVGRADLVPPQPGDLAHTSCCLLQSPHVLTLSFLLLPTPPFLEALRDPPWRRKPWVVKLRTGPPAELAFPSQICFSIMGPGGGHHQLGAQAEATASGKSTCLEPGRTGFKFRLSHTTSVKTLDKSHSMPQFLLFIFGVAM